MPSLRDMETIETVDSGMRNQNAVDDFFRPAFSAAIKYDRVAGYFSSTVLASVGRGITSFAQRRGKMRLLTSHHLTPKDNSALENYFSSSEFSNSLVEEFENSLKSGLSVGAAAEKNHLAAMCWMLKEDLLEIRVVLPERLEEDPTISTFELFHSKFGIFQDSYGNKVAFAGSINETSNAWTRNLENFDIFQSWISGRDSYIDPKINMFEKLWDGADIGPWKTIELPNAVKQKLINDYAPADFPLLEQLVIEEEDFNGLRSYQIDAVKSWEQASRKGILEMATGTGKTRTAAQCISRTQELGSLLTVVIVPYQHIGEQWAQELSDMSPIYATANWRQRIGKEINEAAFGRRRNLTVIVVKNTASSTDFVEMMTEASQDFDNFLLLGDEVHWLGAPTLQNALNESANFRLGLSATPNRYFDEDGTDALFSYFGKSVYELSLEKALTLRDANGDPVLTPYNYHPIPVDLSQNELEKYSEFSQKIIRLRSQLDNAGSDKRQIYEKLELLYILRSNISKSAEFKIPVFEELISGMGSNLKDVLIYCADFNQLGEVAEILRNLQIPTQQITGKEGANASAEFGGLSEREYIISHFAQGEIGVLLAIDCLDEGVDIPSAKTGIILASSGNVKEFIQRRGRLMRAFPGKSEAQIYDFCVLPSGETPTEQGIAATEIKRMYEFAKDCKNSEEIFSFIDDLGIDINDPRHF